MINLRCGDARDVLATLPDASVDAVVTDPPYALTDKQGGAKGFRGARWDTGQVAHDPAFWAEVLRVAKPGAFLLAFAGTRTYHRLACAIEDAGWELRDMLMWLYGSGFPKSKSCLKPAQEPIVLAKAPGPLQPLQIDAARVPTGESLNGGAYSADKSDDGQWGTMHRFAGKDYQQPPGRWPPNTLFSHHPDCHPLGMRRVRGNGHHPATRGTGGLGTAGHGGQQGLTERHLNDEAMPAYACVEGCPVKALDEQAGPRSSGAMKAGTRRGNTCGYRGAMPDQTLRDTYCDSCAVSRFFPTFHYVSKASRTERNAGLEGLPQGFLATMNDGIGAREHNKEQPTAWAANHHPCVKPLALMQWLVRLVTPEGGVVLDPFAGSGSTGAACVREGFGFIGIEQDAGYVEIARARIAHEQERRDGQLALPLGHAYG